MKKVLKILDTSLEENTLIVFARNPIYTLFLLFCFISGGCNKDLANYNPSIYNFHVVDYYSGLPVANAKAVLNNSRQFGANPDQVIGQTDANGLFQYVCNVETINDVEYYSYYKVYFLSGNCPLTAYSFVFSPEYITVEQTHTLTDVVIHLFQSSIVHLTTKRVSVDPMNLGSHYCGFSVSSGDYHDHFTYHSFHKYYLTDTINQIHDTCYCVPSEISEYVISHVLYDCETTQWGWTAGNIINSSDTLHIAYHDTIDLNIYY